MDQTDYVGVYTVENGANMLMYVKCDGGTSSSITLSNGTTYYVRVYGDPDTGANGTIYVKVYSDSSFSVLVDTIAYALPADKDYSVLYAASTYNDSSSGYVWNCTIGSLTIDPVLSEHDVWVIGRSTGEVMDYRVTDVERSGDTMMKITALEYDNTVYYHNDYGSGSTAI
jgi:hypothetical protein